tara:strand:- start:480 stop:686 length:207 start_codon:yes stop_codon:yes gene_type:complete
MKKTFLILALILFSSSAFAGSCPMLWAEIDSKIEEIQKLRDDGKRAHDDGNHSKSEELLKEALKLLNS